MSEAMPVIRNRSSVSTLPSLSFLHWSGPQFVVPAGANRNSGNRILGQIPRSRRAVLEFPRPLLSQ